MPEGLPKEIEWELTPIEDFNPYSIEVDIFVTSKKLCIECDGDYWHNKDTMTKLNDHIKQMEIEARGYRMVRIPYKDWIKKEGNDVLKYIALDKLQ
ncbi:MAG TPA: DUF559 domain-containing protein [Nitrososphaera sp.]|nr:DUF559 domain-containing protein [Nitrososphaera sp.]